MKLKKKEKKSQFSLSASIYLHIRNHKIQIDSKGIGTGKGIGLAKVILCVVEISVNCCKMLIRTSQHFLETLISLVSGKCSLGHIVPENFRTFPKLKVENTSRKCNCSGLGESSDLQRSVLALARLISLHNSFIQTYLCLILSCMYIINCMYV